MNIYLTYHYSNDGLQVVFQNAEGYVIVPTQHIYAIHYQDEMIEFRTKVGNFNIPCTADEAKQLIR